MKKNKKILMLLQAPFPPDIRLEREIKSLASSGFRVGLLCNQYKDDSNKVFPNCDIFRLHAPFNSEKANKIINFPLFLNPRFVYKAIKIYSSFKPDVIHAHDLPMVPLALLIKRLFNVPVVFDMHESYPEALEAFKKRGIINYLFKNPKLAKTLENYSLKKVDKIIVVVEDHKEKLISRGILKEKITVVSNTVDLEIFEQLPSNIEIKNKYDDKFILLYSGGISPDRGLEIPIKSLNILKNRVPNILLIIIGDGAYVETLKKLAKLELVSEYVHFIKWPGHNKLGSYLDIANICVIPQPSNNFINSGIPNKFFEYMSQGKPIIAASLPMERIMKETSCGEVFKSGSSKDFADKVVKISNTKIPYGKNGAKAIIEKYNWDVDAENLIFLYKNFNKDSSYENES